MARLSASDDRVCDFGELFSAYLDGELLPGELDVVVEHLAECEPCILEFRWLKETRAAVRTLPRFEVPERLIPTAHFGSALSAYLDGELATTEHETVFTHLADCAECRHELHELDAARTAVRSLPGLEPPQLLSLERESRPSTATRRHRLRWRVASAAAAAAVVVTFVGVANGSSPADTPNVDLDSLGERHVARASVQPGFIVLPALSGNGATP